MFEPKTYVEQRLAIMEGITNQLLGMRIQTAAPDSEEYKMLDALVRNWQYHGHMAKKNEAERILGGPFQVTEDTATRQWIDQMMRCNLGLLEVFGSGEYNPDPRLPGNDAEKFVGWLQLLEDSNQVVRDTRPSEFYKDSMQYMAGLPVLKIVAEDDKGRKFIHLIVVFEGLTVQSLSIDHLSANWDWDRVPDGWRVEMFSYLNNLSKRVFLRELATAIKVSRGEFWDDGVPVLFVPESDGAAVAMAREITAELGMSYQAVTTIAAEEQNIPSFEGVVEGFGDAVQVGDTNETMASAGQKVIPSEEATTGDC